MLTASMDPSSKKDGVISLYFESQAEARDFHEEGKMPNDLEKR